MASAGPAAAVAEPLAEPRVVTPAPAETGIAARVPDWRAALRATLYAFVLSRLIVLLAGALAIGHAQQWPAENAGAPTLRPFSDQTMARLGERILANDAGWYLGVARDGYAQRPFDVSREENWAFFPLHPWLWRVALATGVDPLVSGLLLANGFFLLALFQAHRWMQVASPSPARSRTQERGHDFLLSPADITVLCIAFFPSAYFFSLPWSESLFLFLLASSLLAMEQRRWGVAATFAALASGTRVVGIALAAVLWLRGRADPQLPALRRWVYAGIATLGLLVFMAVLWDRSGNPLAFADIQEAWGRHGGSLFKHFRRWFQDPGLVAEHWNVRWLTNSCALLGLAAATALWRRGQRALAAFVLFCVLLPWASGSLLGMGRYLEVCLPAFLAFAVWLRRPAVLLAWLLLSACLLAWLSACFFLGASFAGA